MAAKDVQSLFQRIDQPSLRYHVFDEPSADNDVAEPRIASTEARKALGWLRRYAEPPKPKTALVGAQPVRLETLFKSLAQAKAAANAR